MGNKSLPLQIRSDKFQKLEYSANILHIGGDVEDFKCRKTSKDVTLNHNGFSISDPSANAELFNNYSSNIASNLDRDIPHSNTSPLYFLGAPVENSFFCPPSDSEEIVNLIRGQKSKFTDLMNIPVSIYKILAPLIAHRVSIVFNNSLSEGIFPECFKTAKIIPIFKTGDSNSTANYRPISMLPFLSKMFEKLMCARLDSYLKIEQYFMYKSAWLSQKFQYIGCNYRVS